MALSSLDSLRKIRDVDVRWMSYELRPERELSDEDKKHMAAYQRKVDSNWPHIQAMGDAYRVTIGPRNRNARSRLALEGAKFAEEHGRADAYARAVFRAHFVEGRDIGDVPTLVALAREAGLDGDAFQQALEQRAHQAHVDRELALGFMYKLSGVPAFIVGRKYLVVGAQPLETLVDVVDKAASE